MASETEVTEPGKRVYSVACRHGGRDCLFEEGKPNPLDGTKIVAIYALGTRLGYRVSTASAGPDFELSRHVYSVTEIT